MTAYAGRLAGAIVATDGARWFLVGETKEPCDWKAAGFEPPPAGRDAARAAWVELKANGGSPALAGTRLALDLEGEPLARRLAEWFVIERNGSVSERIWNLATDGREGEAVDGRWLAGAPDSVRRVVRDAVLKCL